MLNSSFGATGRQRSALALRLLSAGVGVVLVSTAANAQQYDPFGRDVSGSSQGQSTSTTQQGSESQHTQASPYPVPAERAGPTQIQDTGSAISDPSSRNNGTVDGISDVGTSTTTNGTVANRARAAQPATVTPPALNEFETFVQKRLGRPLPRFGASLIVPSSRTYSVPTTTTVPPDYKLAPGDELFVGLSGSIEGGVRLQIDSNGRVFVPRVGSVNLAGVSFGDVKSVITRAVGQRYRGFDVAVAVSRLRGIRVFVTGFANNPGSYTVDSLSTLVNAVFAAGGPSAGGSFRNTRLIRNGSVVSNFDLYAFLRDGSRVHDAVLQNGDVLDIAPLGDQVALTGSVNQEGIYEVRPGETLNDILRFAGGSTALADPDRLVLYTLANADSVGGVEVARSAFAAQPVAGGDIVQILSKGTLASPLGHQTVVVRIEGEVNHPGNYIVAPGTSFASVVALAGGTTPRSFLYGTVLERVSVRRQQRESYDEALRQLELTLAGAPLTTSSAIAADQATQQAAAGRALLDRLRQAQPDGRVVLPIEPDGSGLPSSLALENNDAIVIPPRPVTVGVFGSVYRPASFLIDGERALRVRDYLRLAGGTLRLADTRDIFVVHVNGSVIPKRAGALNARVLPGDVVFVPARTQNGSFLARLAQVSGIVLNGAIGAATALALTR